MTPEQFIYWLQGFLEIADPKKLDKNQIEIIKDHIALVMTKETPNRGSTQLQPPYLPVVDIPYIHQPSIVCATPDQTLTTYPDQTQLFCSTQDPNTLLEDAICKTPEQVDEVRNLISRAKPASNSSKEPSRSGKNSSSNRRFC
jgi:hypothetical protein